MNKHIARKRIRIKDYDYSSEGAYFITICTKSKEYILSKIVENGETCFTELFKAGTIVNKHIQKMEKIYNNIKIDEYVIMPNHIHLILIIEANGNIDISKIIQQLKGIITKKIGYTIWQKSFYEHIIRNEKEYIMIKQYIIDNPQNWKNDKYY